jgi:TonB family protein
MPAPEQKDGTNVSGTVPDAALAHQQRSRMLVALVVLLVALISMVIKDRQLWFPSSPSSESEAPDEVPTTSASTTAPAPAKVATPLAVPLTSSPVPRQARSKPKRLASANTPAEIAPVVITNRAVLPPLEVEVVAGNQHRTVSPSSSSVKLEMQSSDSAVSEDSPPSTNPDSAPITSNAAARVELSPGTVQVVSRPVDPSYPLLAKQMKVHGAVILEVLISKTGSIQDIQVLSGPAILSAAAREAVKQWHFKPYYQEGRAVETQARITVNFTISTY